MRKGGFRAARRRQPRAPRPGKTLKVSPPRAQAQRAAGARPRRRVAASGAPGRVPFRDGFARPFQRSRPALRGGGSAAAAIARGGGLRDGMHRRRGEMRLRIAGLSFIALSAPVPEGKACGMKEGRWPSAPGSASRGRGPSARRGRPAWRRRAASVSRRAPSCGGTSCANVLPLIVTQCMILFPLVLQIEAALGFLGLGVQPPTPDRARSSRRGRTTSGLPPDVDLPGTCRPRDGARPYPSSAARS